jgi:TIR domain-containing protein/tetratricopeptide repeat protein
MDQRSDVAGSGRRLGDVFISYARAQSGQPARALADLLDRSGVGVFLDTQDEAVGEGILEQVFQALMGSRVVVVFAGATYFTRRYCTEELAVALAPYRALRRQGAVGQALDDAVRPVVVALPASTRTNDDLELLPPEIGSQNWPHEDETDRLAGLVVRRLQRAGETLGQRLVRLGELDGLRERLHEAIVLPVPRPLGDTPVYHEEGMPPSIGEAFVGRSRELWELHNALAVRAGGAAAQTISLEGGGGFGKTRLALEYLHRYGPQEYTGGLLWVNAEVPDDRLEAQQHAILALLRPDVPDLKAFRENGRGIGRELGEVLRDIARTRRVLYVVDNVPEPQGEQPPERLSRWCPALGQVSLLLTSRAQHTLVPGAHRLKLLELTASAARMMLVHGYEDRAALSEESWQEIVEWVGEWPLALELLNASLRSGAMGPRELLAARTQPPARELERQMAALRGSVPEGTLRGVTEALTMSYRRLTSDTRRAVRLLAWLAPSPIPVELVAGMDRSIRTRLRARSFVSEVRSGEVDMYGQMHRVLADFLRGEAEDPQAEVGATCAALLNVMTWDACGDPAKWTLLNTCQPHAEALLDWGAAEATQVELVESLVTLERSLSRLLRTQWDPEAPAGPGAQQRTGAVRSGRRGLELARRRLGDEHRTTAAAALSLAWTLRFNGELEEARSLQERGLEIRRRLLGDDDPDTLTALVNLSTTLRDQGELDRPREMQEIVLEGRRRWLGEEAPPTLWVMSDLAGTLRMQGDLARARELQERVLAAWQRRGDHSRDSLFAMACLAGTLSELGELDRAAALQEQVLEGRRLLLGNEHPDTLRAMADLAETLRGRRVLARARDLEERVLAVRLRVAGEGHPSTLSAMRSLAATVRELGQDGLASALEQRAVEAGRWLRRQEVSGYTF